MCIEENLVEYLWKSAEVKRPPLSVWRATRRETRIEDLCAIGEKRIELVCLSNEELEELYKQKLPDKFFEVRPYPYIVSFCYSKIFEEINNGAVKLEATSNDFQIFNKEGQLLYSLLKTEDEKIFEFREALYWIGAADEVLRPYICEFTWSRNESSITFCWS